jgi:hypothetical protein
MRLRRLRIAVAEPSARWRIRTFADFNVGIDGPTVRLFSLRLWPSARSP